VPTRGLLESCHSGETPDERYAVFAAQMASAKGSRRMLVRFDLQERSSSGKFVRLAAPGLGVWRSSAPGVDIFRYRKQVTNLAAGSEYRALVRFRWLNAAGKTVSRALRRTATCRQPDQRADLAFTTVTAQPAGEGRARYEVHVRNDGRADAPGFAVVLSVGGARQPAQLVDALAGGDRRTLTFTGPRCGPGATLRIELDADFAVDEARESNNARSIPCPLDR
jgi:hypothetical protein